MIYAPIITIESPESDEVFGFESPTFKIYIDGSDLDATWYTLDNGVTNHSFTGLTGKINQESWAQFGNGTVLVKFYVNDSLGNIDSQEIVVRKDIIDPIIDILEPNAYDLYGNDIPAVILDVNEPNLYYMWYSLEDGTEFTDNYTWTGVISQSVWDIMGNGTVRINFYAEDLGKNLGTSYIIVKKDIIAPVMVINEPNHFDQFGSFPPEFTLEIEEPHLDSTWYKLIGNNTIIPFSGLSGFINS
jgi:hypothetical protein